MSVPMSVSTLARTGSMHSVQAPPLLPESDQAVEDEEPEDPAPIGLGPVYASVFIDAAGLAMCIPVLPYFILNLPGGSPTSLGFATSVFSAMQVIGVAMMGRMSDRIGRRRVILFSIAGSGFGFMATALSTSFPTLIAARAFAGLMSGSIPVAQAYITDVTTPRQRTRYLGFIGATIGTAFTIGPAIGALLTQIPGSTPQLVLLSAGVFSFLAFLQALLRLEEPQKLGGAATSSQQGQSAWEVMRTSRPMQILLFATFCCNYNFQVLQTLYALMTKDFFDRGELQLGLILACAGVMMVMVQAVIIKPLIRNLGEVGSAVCACFLLTVFGIIFPMLNTLDVLIPHVACLLLYISGYAISNTSIPSLMAGYADPSQVGAILGLGQSTAAFARMVAPVVSGWLYEVSMEISMLEGSRGPLFIGFGQLPFLVGCVLTFFATLLVFAIRNNASKAAGASDDRGPDPTKLATSQEMSQAV